MPTSYVKLAALNDPHTSSRSIHDNSTYYWEDIPQDMHRLEEALPLPKDDNSSEDVITTGWDRSLLLLLFQGLISVAWGAALCVFALVRVPIAWTVSQLGKNNPATTNTIVTLVATLSTLHITYILQRVIEEYSKSLLLSGFTLGHLTWLQGVTEMSIFTKFPDAKRGPSRLRSWPKERLLWIVVYGGFAVHASSLVAILQPREQHPPS